MNFKRGTAMLLALCMMLCMLPATQTNAVSENDFTYTISDGKATITGYSGAGGDITIPSILGGYPVTEIGDFAFGYNGDLTSVQIPAGVTRIGQFAFIVCTSLEAVTIPEGVTTIDMQAFGSCTSLKTVRIPASATEVSAYAFAACLALTGIQVDADNPNYSSDAAGVWFNKDQTALIQIPAGATGAYTIPDTVTRMENGALNYCWNLTALNAGENNPAYSSADGVLFNKDKTTLIRMPGAFAGSYQIPEGVTSIGTHAFYYCSKLTAVTIPNTVTTLGDTAFCGCASLTSVVLPEGVTAIPNSGFAECTDLQSLTIPTSVTSIGYSAFVMCSQLTDIYYLGTSDQWAQITIYDYNDEIQSMTIHYQQATDPEDPEQPEDTSGSCGEDASWELDDAGTVTITGTGTIDDAIASNPNVVEVVVSEGVTAIGANAFFGCENLKTVILPDSVTTIGNGAFYNCSSLETIVIPETVTTVGAEAFVGCSSLSEAIIGKYTENHPAARSSDVVNTQIEAAAFAGCTGLTKVTLGNNVTSIGQMAFYGCDNLQQVTYCGTEQQWSAISIDDGNAALTDATRQYHNYVDGVCTICGTVQAPEHTHEYSYADNGDGTHTVSCACEEEYVEPHSYADGVCTGCGAVAHVHSFSYSDNGDGTHTASCTCNDHYVEPHGFENGVCFRCGVAEVHEHEWNNGACSGCGQSLAEIMDLSGDDKVTAFDAQILAEATAGTRQLTEEQWTALGDLTAQDIVSYVLGTFGTNT